MRRPRSRKLEVQRGADSPLGELIVKRVGAHLECDLREIDVARKGERTGEILVSGRLALVVVQREVSDLQIARIFEVCIERDGAGSRARPTR